jgi:cysteine desulfurase
MKGSFLSTKAYFDCNATTAVLPAAAQAALEAMHTLYGNPSSTHLVGLQAKFILESTRKTAGRVIGAAPEQIIFTSGATEAIQTSVFSVLQSIKKSREEKKTRSPIHLLYGATEHKVIPQALHHWVNALNLPFKIVELPVDSRGQLRLDVLRSELPSAALLCTMAVNNETGVVQDLAAIEGILAEQGSAALWLVDCVQALGKQKLELASRRIDYAAFSGHKLYAPKGIGFLYVRKGAPFTPLIVGGGQEKGQRSGTENLPGVAAFGAVLNELLKADENSVFHSFEALLEFREKIIISLQGAFKNVEFNTPLDCSVPTTINFSVPGFSSKELLDLFDSAGLRISAGSACSATSVKPSHVLDAMGISLINSTSALRLSFGPYTSEREIERGCQIIKECAAALQNTCLLYTNGAFEAPEYLRDGVVQLRAGSTNSWILADRASRNCVIIDPCDTLAERIEQYVLCQQLHVLAILDTHSHGDHESIRLLLKRFLASSMDLAHPTNEDSLGWSLDPAPTIKLDNGESAPFIAITPSLVLARVPTPGHTDDSTALLLGEVTDGHLKKENIRFVFSGDTILSGGLGRTNFAVSNSTSLFHSLRRLKNIVSPQTLLCPTHDYNNSFATNLQAETEGHPLLSLALGAWESQTLDLFLETKAEIDMELAQLEKSFQGIVCGVTPVTRCTTTEAVTMPPGSLEEMLAGRDTLPWVIDVREPAEFLLFKDWETVGLKKSPRNIPLSRFVNFMDELTAQKKMDQEVILICRSGNRSLQAAKALRSLGFTRVWSLDGGVSLSGQS